MSDIIGKRFSDGDKVFRRVSGEDGVQIVCDGVDSVEFGVGFEREENTRIEDDALALLRPEGDLFDDVFGNTARNGSQSIGVRLSLKKRNDLLRGNANVESGSDTLAVDDADEEIGKLIQETNKVAQKMDVEFRGSVCVDAKVGFHNDTTGTRSQSGMGSRGGARSEDGDHSLRRIVAMGSGFSLVDQAEFSQVLEHLILCWRKGSQRISIAFSQKTELT